MRVEIWSDFACPFCYIGKTYYEKALSEVEFADQIQTIYKSFELDPYASKDNKISTFESLAKKYGTSLEQAKQMTQSVVQRATEAGLTFKFDQMLSVSTFDAHRLMHYAATTNQQKELSEALFYAYFTENKDLDNIEVLQEIASKLGIDAKSILANKDQYASQVKQDQSEANQLGVQGVPFFVIDRKYAISGAQPITVFVETLKKAWSERSNTFTTVSNNSDGTCGPDNCNI